VLPLCTGNSYRPSTARCIVAVTLLSGCFPKRNVSSSELTTIYFILRIFPNQNPSLWAIMPLGSKYEETLPFQVLGFSHVYHATIFIVELVTTRFARNNCQCLPDLLRHLRLTFLKFYHRQHFHLLRKLFSPAKPFQFNEKVYIDLLYSKLFTSLCAATIVPPVANRSS